MKKQKAQPYRILITGSKNWTDKATIRHAIFETWKGVGSPKNTVLLVDGARGANSYAQRCGEAFGFIIEQHNAGWKIENKSAGPQRNQHMVNAGADICLAFLIEPSVGTIDCIERAKEAGIPVEIYSQET